MRHRSGSIYTEPYGSVSNTRGGHARGKLLAFVYAQICLTVPDSVSVYREARLNPGVGTGAEGCVLQEPARATGLCALVRSP